MPYETAVCVRDECIHTDPSKVIIISIRLGKKEENGKSMR